MNRVVDSRMLTDQQLMLLGLDPSEVRMLEDELAGMGMGLGISFKGIFRGIGKAARGIAKGAKFVARTAVRAVPAVAPIVAGGAVGVPAALLARKLLSRKPRPVPAVSLRRAVAQRVRAVPPAAIVPPPVIQPIPSPVKPVVKPAVKQPTIIERIIEKAAPVVEKAAPVVAEVAPALIPAPPPPPAPVPVPVPVSAPAPVTVTRAGFDMSAMLLPLAIGGLALLLLAGKR